MRSAIALASRSRRRMKPRSRAMAVPMTLFDKIWSSHAILVRPDGATVLHIDRHLVHDGSGNAFRMLKEKGLAVRRPDRTFATPDHYRDHRQDRHRRGRGPRHRNAGSTIRALGIEG